MKGTVLQNCVSMKSYIFNEKCVKLIHKMM